MRNYIKFIFMITTCLLLNLSEIQAAHVFGCDLSYRCMGSNQYEITLTLYRDCDGTSAATTMDIGISSYSCNQALSTISLQIDSSQSGIMTTPLCSTFAPSSTCFGGGLPGEDILVYKGIATLAAQCPDWIVNFTFAVRSSYYTNLINPASDNIYIEALIDNSFGGCYDSPVFRNHPMLYACAGQPFSHDMGAIDWQGDTLKYSLLTPMASASQNANFQGGLSHTAPLVLQGGYSFDLNKRTGEISFTSQVGLNQFAAVSLRVDKWHGGKIVASTMAELDIAVNASCVNASILPTETSVQSDGWYYNDTLGAFISCNGATSPFSFKHTLYDKNGDAIAVNSSSLDSIFGASNWTSFANTSPPFSLDSVEYNYQISSPLNPLPFSTTSYLSFAIEYTDNSCPYSSKRSLSYLTFPAFIKAAASDCILCEGNPQTVQLSMSGTHPPSNIQWTQITTTAPTVPLSNPNISNPVLTVPSLSAGHILQYQVSATVDSCNVVDTITLHVVDTPSISLQINNASNVSATDGSATISVTGNLAQFNYQWQTGSTSATINNLGAGDYWVTATDYYGCQAVDTAMVGVGTSLVTIANNLPPFKVYPNPTKDKTIHIQLNTSTSESISFSVYNSLGQVVATKTILPHPKQKTFNLELKQQLLDLYWLQIQVGKKTYSQKVVLN